MAYSVNAEESMAAKVKMEVVEKNNESYFKITHHDAIRPFFMSIVSDSNHWMFISSNGGLTAGRKNPEYALFPYYTEDKLTEFADFTGSKSIFQVRKNGNVLMWEPFSERFADHYKLSRNLYKSIYGNKIIFEEINHDLGLAFSYQWNSSKSYGFVRKAQLANLSEEEVQLTMLDGIQNIMPYGVPSDLQRSTSNLVDAYKRSELEPESGMGIFGLSAIIVDKAEPSEALKTNVAWSVGLEKPLHLLSSLQLGTFRKKGQLQEEADVKGEKGAYFLSTDLALPAKAEKNWMIVANVNQTYAQVISLSRQIIAQTDLEALVQRDIDAGTESLIELVAGADGLQCSADQLNDTRHFSNVLFNIMRGGTFDNNYQIGKSDFVGYIRKANKEVFERNQEFFSKLDEVFTIDSLRMALQKSEDVDLIRLSTEYLPLKFSRRHGDPSRPWNYFSINTESETDGSKILDYEGNWRDLFQNWEALAHAYPEFISGMIFKFLNASTFDGYNPYRVTKDGFDWETIEPDNPWSYIGYWGDHQIIYLQKFFEIAEQYEPGSLQQLFDKEWFVYAAVPYLIKPYSSIVENPKDTISFDHHWDTTVRQRRDQLGADGALLTLGDKGIYHVSFLEKILASVLAKLSNFIPEAGIWMNTQRPEWNDANNALVGNGVSMVTLYYLHRFMKFFDKLLDSAEAENYKISSELAALYHSVRDTFEENAALLSGKISDRDRKTIVDRLGKAASDYRWQIYENGFWGKKRSISLAGLKTFARVSLDFIEHSIRANQRPDNLFHAYNLRVETNEGVSYAHLSEMLEGQVAVLSSGYLQPQQALDVLNGLKDSTLFREDQYTYILYPNKKLPGFLQKNNIPKEDVMASALINNMLSKGNKSIVEKDILGGYHFNGNFKNARDLEKALNELMGGEYTELAQKEKHLLLNVFEKVFNHKAFTGRSGTFYSYEGLGSIYWHMVSKLHLAVQENCLKAINEKADPVVVGKLLDHYYEIDAGIGVHKSPALYGAFPTDPYSHTPKHRGAQQPGMTGQVKEDILVHLGELGVFVEEGCLHFKPSLLREKEFLKSEQDFEYHTVSGELKNKRLKAGQLGFSCCQTLVIYQLSDKEYMHVLRADGSSEKIEGHQLDRQTSEQIFRRNGTIDQIEVFIKRKS